MKTIVISDLHGSDVWQKILSKEKSYDRVIFLGDFFDSRDFTIGKREEILNFGKILEMKMLFPKKIILLCGNHDLNYIHGFLTEDETYDDEMDKLMKLVFKNKMLQSCYFDVELNISFSHAGISEFWVKEHVGFYKNFTDLHQKTNNIFYKNSYAFEYHFDERDTSQTGDSILQSPCWIRPESLFRSKIKDLVQVVGHTKQMKVNFENGIWFTDLYSAGETYLVFENGKPKIQLCQGSKP